VLAHQRQSSILAEVTRQGGARVADLVRSLGVSDMTIRRDIEALAERGLVAKVHGGAVAVGRAADEPRYSAKSTQQQPEKLAIARAAAALAQPGQAIGISAGTTTTATLAACLLTIPDLTVVTNSIPVEDAFYRGGRADQTVVLSGGTRTVSDALVGPVAETALAQVNFDVLFLGVYGMNPHAGFTTPNLAEAEINRALLAAAGQVVELADHTKWDLIGIATIAPLTAAHLLITDTGLNGAAQTLLRNRIGQLIVVAPDGSGRAQVDERHRLRRAGRRR
jgi:DeoR/GlpR family transcriptional regulator of sugar metabolism